MSTRNQQPAKTISSDAALKNTQREMDRALLDWQRAIQAYETAKALKYGEPEISVILLNAAERESELKAALKRRDAAVWKSGRDFVIKTMRKSFRRATQQHVELCSVDALESALDELSRRAYQEASNGK